MSTAKGTKTRRFSGASSTRNWETDDSSAFLSYTKTGSSTVWSPSSTTRQILSKHKPMSANARMDDGWRNPTPFRSYVCVHRPGRAFEYEAENASGTKVIHKGDLGYLPNNTDMGVFMGVTGAGHFPRVSANLVNRTTVEALNKLKGNAFNLAESLATLDKTLELVVSVATRMRDLWRLLNAKNIANRALWDRCQKAYYSAIRHNVSRRKIRRRIFFRSWGLPSSKPPKSWWRLKTSNLWLELQYGWKPLVQDIKGALAVWKGIKPLCHAVRHLEENEAPIARPITSGALMETKGTIINGCHVRVDAELTSHGLVLMDALGLVNPFSLGWELLPYSFVLDWLLPIGNAISALTAPLGLDLMGISTTQFTKANVAYKWCQFKNRKWGNPIEATACSLATYRTASFFWPFPRVYIKSPFTSATRAATALSLLTKLH